MLAITLLLISATLSARVADSDSGYDLFGLLRAVGLDAAHLRWQYATAVMVLAVAHYLATAVAARSAAGIALPMRETLLVQLAASAANRLTPAGLGGSAVTARYFSRRGLPVAGALGAVVALNLLGALADLLVVLLLVFAGRLVGLGGAPAELSLLGSKLSGLLAPLRSQWMWLALGAILVALVVSYRYLAVRLAGVARRFRTPIVALKRHPAALLTLMAASASTTLILAFAFVASSAMVPGPEPAIALGGLLVGFMLGAAAGNAVPTPAGAGSTETALVAVLATSGVPVAHAVEVVLIFRVITFWIPALAGVLAARHLRRSGAL